MPALIMFWGLCWCYWFAWNRWLWPQAIPCTRGALDSKDALILLCSGCCKTTVYSFGCWRHCLVRQPETTGTGLPKFRMNWDSWISVQFMNFSCRIDVVWCRKYNRIAKNNAQCRFFLFFFFERIWKNYYLVFSSKYFWSIPFWLPS